MSKKINFKIFRKRTLQLTKKTHKILFLAEIIINDVVHSNFVKIFGDIVYRQSWRILAKSVIVLKKDSALRG
jgi:hypothetical protein